MGWLRNPTVICAICVILLVAYTTFAIVWTAMHPQVITVIVKQ